MKFLSFVRLFGERRQRSGSGSERPAKRRRSSTRMKGSHLHVERLEQRELLSVVPELPIPAVITHGQIAGSTGPTPSTPGAANLGNFSAPSVAIDPINPQKMFAVWTRNDPDPTHGIFANASPVAYFIRVEAAFSTNGGTSWVGLGQLTNNQIDPVQTTPGPPLTIVNFAAADSATVAFDRNENVYVTELEHDLAFGEGGVYLQKFSFTGGAPAQTITNRPLYRWAIQEPAFNPVVTVDTNLPSYTDPVTGKTQLDSFSNTIYVSWNTNNTAPGSNPGVLPFFNPNAIKLLASNDAGVNWTAETFLNAGFLGFNNLSGNNPVDHYSNPQLAVSQGNTANGGSVPGGQLTAVFNDFGQNTTIGNTILANRIQNGGEGVETQGATGPIFDALPTPSGGTANIPQTTTLTATVSIANGKFVLDDLDVNMDLVHTQLQQVRIDLIAPPDVDNPFGLDVPLLFNHLNPDGTQNTGIGVQGGDNLGVINELISGLTKVGTTFDQQSLRLITDTADPAHFSGHYRPEAGNLNVFNGWTPLGIPDGMGGFKHHLNGAWQLLITDNINDTNPVQSMLDWKLVMTSALTPVGTTTVGSTKVNNVPLVGAFNSNYPLKPTSDPNVGIGPAPVIASDNTLGSFSPYQGRLYVTFVRPHGPDNPNNGTPLGLHGDSTDVVLATSDNGGASWTFRGAVNNDDGQTDGFSEANSNPLVATVTDRTKFSPNLQVDPANGTVVVSFSDARYDAADARIARMIASSEDGGLTFGSQTFLNRPEQPFDEITGKNVPLGPIPDNQSAAYIGADTTYAFGNTQSLLVANGKVFAAWSGNENAGNLRILNATTTLTNGPRALASTMGPTSGQAVQLLNGSTMTFNNGHALSVGDVTVHESDAGTVTATFTVFLNAPNSQAVTFNYASADGTAIGGIDYTPVGGTLTIPAGQSSITIAVPILSNPTGQGDHTFTLKISNPVNAGIARTTGTGTIVDNDKLVVSIGDLTQLEGNGSSLFTFNVYLSAPTTRDVTVNYVTANNSAKAGVDYTAASGTVLIPAGATSATVNVTVLGNTTPQTNRDFFVNLNSPSNASIAKGRAVGTIIDDDGIPDVSAGDLSQTIGNSGQLTVSAPVFLSFPLTQAVNVTYTTVDGTAKAGTDYVAVSGTLTIPAGATSGAVQIVVLANPNSPRDRNFSLSLTGSNLSAIVRSQGNITLIDNAKVPDISIGDVTVAAQAGTQGVATFTVFLSNPSTQDVSFSFATADGTALSGQDYLGTAGPQVGVISAGSTSMTFTVPILADPSLASNITFFVNLSSPANGAIVRSQGLGTIIADSGAIGVSIGDATLQEGNIGTTNFVFPVFLNVSSAQNFLVNYTTVDGTAKAGTDYLSTSGTLFFPAGGLTSTITVPVLGNINTTTNRTFSVNLSSPNFGSIARPQGNATIVEDDGLTLSVGDVTLSAPASGAVNANFTVTLSHAAPFAVTFTYSTADGTALSGTNYTGTSVPVTVTIPANSTSFTISVPVLSNPVAQGNTSFLVNLTKPVNAAIFRSQGTGTIIHDSKLSLSVSDVTSFEGNSGATPFTFFIFLSAPSSQDVSVAYTTVAGTATPGLDYQTTAGIALIPAGQTSVPVTVPVFGNVVPQPNRAFTVVLSNPSKASIQRGTGTGTIVDDDQVPTVTVGDATLRQPSSGATNASFPVFLSFPLTRAVTINYATANGTALAGSDYALSSGTLTIPAGATSAIISVPVFGNAVNQPNTTFTVSVSSPTNASILRGTGIGTLINSADHGTTDGTPTVNGFTVTFDRFINPGTFTTADVVIRYRDPNTTGHLPGVVIPAVAVVPLFDADFAALDGNFGTLGAQAAFGARKFLVTFPAQSGTGTYSYAIGPVIGDNLLTPVNLLVSPGGTFTSILSVAGLPDLVSGATVNVTMEQGLDKDLTLTLIAPDGTPVLLSKNEGGATGQNFFNTTFSDGAATAISAGAAPFTGSFKPEQPLNSTLLNKNPNGNWTLQIQDSGVSRGKLLQWSLILQPSGQRFTTSVGHLMDQNANANAGQLPGANIGDVYAVPRPVAGSTVNPNDWFTPPYAVDSLPLIIPGPHVVKTFVDSTFTPAPAQLGLAIPPSGTGGTGIPAQDVTSSTLVISGGDAAQIINNLTVNLTLRHTNDSDLVITLVAPDGTKVLLANQEGGAFQNFTNTTFSDGATIAVSAGAAPFNGLFRPESPLSALNGKLLNGTWTLQIQDTKAVNSGTLIKWSLTAATSNPNTNTDISQATNGTVSSIDVVFDRDMQAPNPNDSNTFGPQSIQRILGPGGTIASTSAFPYTVLANPFGTDPDATHPRTFRISFAPQALSGTYAVTFGPNIKAKNGDLLDNNLNAGLDMLRETPSNGTAPTVYTSTDVGASKIIGDPSTTGKVTKSVINVPDSYLVAGLTLQLNITYPNDPDLQATLIAPDGTTDILFDFGTGSTPQPANFNNTIFDDSSATNIVNGGNGFFGRFSPQLPLDTFVSLGSAGTWTLQIIDSAAGTTGTLNAWSLTLLKPQPLSGLGEPVSDQTTTSFRIFTLDPANPLSHSDWTAVGPAAIGTNGRSGVVTAIGVDPSDPSGNTVFVGGASGGVWKTTNFLTTDPHGPIYVPLTDFGPTFGLNVASIAVFPRNNDPKQTIVFAATGEAISGVVPSVPGVGFLRSMDGGATWTLLDSTSNFDTQTGLPLPENSPAPDGQARDHAFIGIQSYKIIVDTQSTPTNGVVVYAALSAQGASGGVWRSLDTGKTWSLMKGGDPTDIVLDPDSGTLDALSRPTGNLQILYAAFRGQGVFISPNEGKVFNLVNGLSPGHGLIRDRDIVGGPAVPVNAPSTTPSTFAGGVILLAKPALTGSPLQDLLYEGWIYALSVNAGNGFGGLYLSKDFGANWTSIAIPTHGPVPTNDSTAGNFNVFGNSGNYAQSFAVDPLNPNVVYIGGADFLRVDTTGVSDPYALYLSSLNNTLGDTGKSRYTTTDPVGARGSNFNPSPPNFSPGYLPASGQNGFINFIHNPSAPFGVAATVFTTGANNFANTGAGIKWIHFDEALVDPLSPFYISAPPPPTIFTTNQHALITMRDPITGHTRLIFGDDQGVYTGVDLGNGTFVNSIGSTNNLDDFDGDISAVTGSRNGNLQITQFYYGAAQPSDLASQLAGIPGLYYGMSNANGFPTSDPNVLTNGNLVWTDPTGGTEAFGQGVATDQTGTGTVYQFKWPCCTGHVGTSTDFFQVNDVGRTFGLVGPTLPDPQWPSRNGFFNFAVNPINGNEIIISSANGNIYGTIKQGAFWLLIGDPTTGALDGSNAQALAYGAPDPNDPTGHTNDFLYAGTVNGHIYVTFTGGGNLGNQWLDISAGLDGAPVKQIITNPNRSSHEAYAVTATGVFHMVDSSAAGATWQKVSGNLFQVSQNVFNPFNETVGPQLTKPQTQALATIQADWRYSIPDNPVEYNNPAAPPGPTHPVLYVGGNSGVYRSIDGGVSWTIFPTIAQSVNNPNPNLPNDGAVQNGGFLPNALVSNLNLALGNIDPNTGHPLVAGVDPKTGVSFVGPDTLLASTYGRGDYAIRVAPIIVPGSLQLDPTLPAPFGSNPGPNFGTINVLTPVLDGMSEQSAFGNTVKVQLFDLTPDVNGNPPVNPPNIGVDPTALGNNFAFTNQGGRFKIQVKAGYFTADGKTDGVKVFGIQPIDASGAVGQMQLFTFTLDTTPFIHNGADAPHFDTLLPLGISAGGSDSGLSVPIPGAQGTFIDKLTNVTRPFVDGVVSQAAPVVVELRDQASNLVIGSGSTDANGNFSIQVIAGFYKGDGTTDGVHTINVVAPHVSNNNSPVSLTFTLDTTPPATPSAPSLIPSSDTGFSNTDHITSLKTPTFSGSGEARAQVLLFANGVLVGNDVVNSLGKYLVTASTPLNDGVYDMTAELVDFAGNASTVSASMIPKLIVTTKAPSVPTLKLDPGFATAGLPNTTSAVPSSYDGTSDSNTIVTIFDNGQLIDTFTQANSSKNFIVSLNLADGQHLLTATATDQAGNTATFAPLNPDGKLGLEITVNQDALDASRKFIREIYSDALGRPGSIPEWNSWIGLLSQPNGRFFVANAINRSFEARDVLIRSWYLTYLGRPASGGEESSWVNAMVNFNLTEEQVLSSIMASPEYFFHAAAVVGAATPTNATFVTALYEQILKRVPNSAEVNSWVQQIPKLGRQGVAASFLASIEYRRGVVFGYYANLLRRPTAPTLAEVDSWAFSSLDITSIRVAFEASVEFYFRVTGFMP